MTTPHTAPAPSDLLARVHAYARDLAYGASIGAWTTDLWEGGGPGGGTLYPMFVSEKAVEAALYADKWPSSAPPSSLLVTFGYARLSEVQDTQRNVNVRPNRYLLTQKAMELLSQPAEAPAIFISYRRAESAAFALAIEARFRVAGHPGPFVDKNLQPGEAWYAGLETRIAQSRYCIVLIGPTTFQSAYVTREVEWAQANPTCTVIPVWHNGALPSTAPAELPPGLLDRHAVQVVGDTAAAYESAINQVLNATGYATY